MQKMGTLTPSFFIASLIVYFVTENTVAGILAAIACVEIIIAIFLPRDQGIKALRLGVEGIIETNKEILERLDQTAESSEEKLQELTGAIEALRDDLSPGENQTFKNFDAEGPHYYRAKDHFVDYVREGAGETERVAQTIRSAVEEGGKYESELERLLFTVETESVATFEQSESASFRTQAPVRRQRFEALKNLLLPSQK